MQMEDQAMRKAIMQSQMQNATEKLKQEAEEHQLNLQKTKMAMKELEILSRKQEEEQQFEQTPIKDVYSEGAISPETTVGQAKRIKGLEDLLSPKKDKLINVGKGGAVYDPEQQKEVFRNVGDEEKDEKEYQRQNRISDLVLGSISTHGATFPMKIKDAKRPAVLTCDISTVCG